MLDQVRRQSESDEPKCKNCQHWAGNGIHIAPCMLSKVETDKGDGVVAIKVQWTTDLSLCSRWERK